MQGSSGLLQGAVTLQLDPAVRAAVLAVPPPQAARARATPHAHERVAPLIGMPTKFILPLDKFGGTMF